MGLADLERDLEDKPKGGGLAALAADVDAPTDRTLAGRLYEDYVAKPLASAAGFLLTSGSPAQEMGGRRGGVMPQTDESAEGERRGTKATRKVVGEVVVPQTLTELGTQVGTAGAGKAASVIKGTGKAVKAGQAAIRTAGATTGAAAGAAAGGDDPVMESLKAAGITGLLETAVPVVGKVTRSLPGAKGRIAADDADKIGAWLEKHTDLPSARTAKDMRAMAAGPGLDAAGAAKEARVQIVERLIGDEPLVVRSLDPSRGLSLREANAQLSEIGDMMRGIKPLDPRYKDVDLKKLYGRAATELREAIAVRDPNIAAPLWDALQEGYRKSRRGLDLITPKSTYRPYPDETQFNTPRFQDRFTDPKVERALRKAFGDDAYEELVAIATRGGGAGTRDQLAPGQGRMTDALRMFMEGKGGTASVLAAIPRTLFPNFSSRYAGRQPYSADPLQQIILDLAGQRVGAGAER